MSWVLLGLQDQSRRKRNETNIIREMLFYNILILHNSIEKLVHFMQLEEIGEYFLIVVTIIYLVREVRYLDISTLRNS